MLFIDYYCRFDDYLNLFDKFILFNFKNLSPMKTITPKDAFKLFLFIAILFSAKAISHPKLPKEAGSTCESKMGCVNKVESDAKKAPATYTELSRGNSNVKQSKNIASKSSLTPRVSLKAGIGK